jgi:hypothetical protein
MITAGFQGLCSKAAASIVANNGDPIKAIKSLASEDTVKSLATTMISAGVMHKVCNVLNIPKFADRELLDHAKYNIIKSSVSATLSMSIDGQNMEDAILDGIVNAAISTVTASLVAKIDIDKTDDIKHNIIQTIFGGVKGTLVGDNGTLVGALDGLISAIMPNDLFVADEEAKKGSINIQEKEDQNETNLDDLENKEKGKGRIKISQISDEYEDDEKLYKNQDKEQILEQQKQRLAAQIINNLNLQRYLQANLQGVNFDLNQMAEIIINKIDAMDIKDLSKLERAFNFYSLQPTEIREFKVVNTIFENELPIKEPSSTTDGAKSFWQRFKENYVKFQTEQDEVDIAINRAQSEETLRLLEKYRVGTRAIIRPQTEAVATSTETEIGNINSNQQYIPSSETLMLNIGIGCTVGAINGLTAGPIGAVSGCIFGAGIAGALTIVSEAGQIEQDMKNIDNQQYIPSSETLMLNMGISCTVGAINGLTAGPIGAVSGCIFGAGIAGAATIISEASQIEQNMKNIDNQQYIPSSGSLMLNMGIGCIGGTINGLTGGPIRIASGCISGAGIAAVETITNENEQIKRDLSNSNCNISPKPKP